MGNPADFTGPINQAIGDIVENVLNSGSDALGTAQDENAKRTG